MDTIILHRTRFLGCSLEGDYPLRVILGKAVLRECITWDEFVREGNPDIEKFSGDDADNKPNMLIFGDQEFLTPPIPYICSVEFFHLDKEMKNVVNATLISATGFFDSSPTILFDIMK